MYYNLFDGSVGFEKSQIDLEGSNSILCSSLGEKQGKEEKRQEVLLPILFKTKMAIFRTNTSGKEIHVDTCGFTRKFTLR